MKSSSSMHALYLLLIVVLYAILATPGYGQESVDAKFADAENPGLGDPNEVIPPLELMLTEEPEGQAIDKVDVVFEREATSTVRTFFLSAAGLKKPLDEVTLFTRMSDQTASIAVVGDSDTVVTLPKKGELVLDVTFVAQPTKFGQWTGELYAQHKSVVVKLADVILMREHNPNLTVVGALPGTGLALSSRSVTLKSTVVLEGGLADVKTVSIDVSPFMSATNTQAAVSVSGADRPLDLASSAQHELTIEAQLPEAGVYRSAIRIRHANLAVISIPLSVTRTKAEPEIVTPATVRVKDTLNFHDGAVLDFVVHIDENSGVGVTLEEPSVLDFGLVDESDIFQPEAMTITFTDRDGNSLRTPLELPPSHGADVNVQIADVKSAGKYQGRLLISEPGGMAKEVTLVALVNHSWWLLVLLVSVGAMVVSGVNWLVTSKTKQLNYEARNVELRFALADVVSQLDKQRDAAVSSVLAALDSQVDLADSGAKIELVRQKLVMLPDWVTLHLRITALETELGVLIATEKDAVAAAQSVLVSSTVNDANLKASAKSLIGIGAALDAARVARLTELTDEFNSLCTSESSADSTSFHHAASLVKVQRLAAQIGRISKNLDAGKLEEATTLYERLRSEYLDAAISDQDLYLTNKPGNFPQQPWTDLQKDIVRLGNDAEPIDLYRERSKLILASYARVLAANVESRWKVYDDLKGKKNKEGKPLLGADDLTDLTALSELKQRILEANSAIGLSQTITMVGSARHTVDSIAKRLLKIPTQPRGTPMAELARYSEDTVELPPVVLLYPRAPPPDVRQQIAASRLTAMGRKHQIEQALKQLDLLALAVALILAVLIALTLLYNDTWGTREDILAALLWGAGIKFGTDFSLKGGIQSLAATYVTQSLPSSSNDKPSG